MAVAAAAAVADPVGVPASAALVGVMQEEIIEEMLSERLVDGCILLDKYCPSCVTPLLKQMDDLVLGEVADDNSLKVAKSQLTTKSAQSLKPVDGVPFCVGCQAHVVTSAMELDMLEANSAKEQFLTALALEDEPLFTCGAARDTDDISQQGYEFVKSVAHEKREADSATSSPSRRSSKSKLSVKSSKVMAEGEDAVSTQSRHSTDKSAKSSKSSAVVKEDDEDADTTQSHHSTNKSTKSAKSIKSAKSTKETMEDDEDAASIQSPHSTTSKSTQASVKSEKSAKSSKETKEGDAASTHSRRSTTSKSTKSVKTFSNKHSSHSPSESRKSSKSPNEVEDDDAASTHSCISNKSVQSAKSVSSKSMTSTVSQHKASDRFKRLAFEFAGDGDVEIVRASSSVTSRKTDRSAIMKVVVEENPIEEEHRQDDDGAEEETPTEADGLTKAEPETEGSLSPESGVSEIDIPNDCSVDGEALTAEPQSFAELEEEWLTYEEKKAIATKALGVKMMQGYTLLEEQCPNCIMPMTEFQGEVDCVVCPALEKKTEMVKKQRGKLEKTRVRVVVETQILQQQNLLHKKRNRLIEKTRHLNVLAAAQVGLNKSEKEASIDVEAIVTAQNAQELQKSLSRKETFDTGISTAWEEEGMKLSSSGLDDEQVEARSQSNSSTEKEISDTIGDKEDSVIDASSVAASKKSKGEGSCSAKSLPFRTPTADKTDLQSISSMPTKLPISARSRPVRPVMGIVKVSPQPSVDRSPRLSFPHSLQSKNSAMSMRSAKLQHIEETESATPPEQEIESAKSNTRSKHSTKSKVSQHLQEEAVEESATPPEQEIESKKSEARSKRTTQSKPSKVSAKDEDQAVPVSNEGVEIETGASSDDDTHVSSLHSDSTISTKSKTFRKSRAAQYASAKKARKLTVPTVEEASETEKDMGEDSQSGGGVNMITATQSQADSTSESSHQKHWESLRTESRAILARRRLVGWKMLPETCNGTECGGTQLVAKEGTDNECVICGGTGTGVDGVYALLIPDVLDAADPIGSANPSGGASESVAPEDIAKQSTKEEKSTKSSDILEKESEAPMTLQDDTSNASGGGKVGSVYGAADIAVSKPPISAMPIGVMSVRSHDQTVYSGPASITKLHRDFESKRSAVSQKMAEKMAEGWTLLNLTCPQCVMPLMSDGNGRSEICLLCGVVGSHGDGSVATESTGSQSTDHSMKSSDEDSLSSGAEPSVSGSKSKKKEATATLLSANSDIKDRILRSAAYIRRATPRGDPPAQQGYCVRRQQLEVEDSRSALPFSQVSMDDPSIAFLVSQEIDECDEESETSVEIDEDLDDSNSAHQEGDIMAVMVPKEFDVDDEKAVIDLVETFNHQHESFQLEDIATPTNVEAHACRMASPGMTEASLPHMSPGSAQTRPRGNRSAFVPEVRHQGSVASSSRRRVLPEFLATRPRSSRKSRRSPFMAESPIMHRTTPQKKVPSKTPISSSDSVVSSSSSDISSAVLHIPVTNQLEGMSVSASSGITRGLIIDCTSEFLEEMDMGMDGASTISVARSVTSEAIDALLARIDATQVELVNAEQEVDGIHKQERLKELLGRLSHAAAAIHELDNSSQMG